jgi:single-strand DNA-binding protein
MPSYQHVVVIGNIGSDPEMRFTPNGVPVTGFSLAYNESWKNAAGEKQEKTTWFRVSCWNKLAESAAQWLTKGQLVLVEGKVEARAYEGKDGQPHASLELTASNWRFMGGKGEAAEADPARDDAGFTAAMRQRASEESEDAPF